MLVGSSWRQLLDLNPPHFHLLVLPLAKLSLETSARVWLIANALAALASTILIVRELQLRIARPCWLPLTCLGLASVATGANCLSAQCTGLLMLPMTLGPGWLQDIARATPFRYIIDAMREAFQGHYTGNIMIEGVGVAVGMAALCLWVASRAFVRENA